MQFIEDMIGQVQQDIAVRKEFLNLVLPLYLGCNCVYKQELPPKIKKPIAVWQLSRLLTNSRGELTATLTAQGYMMEVDAYGIMPILRPFSDMSHEEAAAGNIWSLRKNNEPKVPIGFYSAIELLFLTRHRFDIFDLHLMQLCLYQDERYSAL